MKRRNHDSGWNILCTAICLRTRCVASIRLTMAKARWQKTVRKIGKVSPNPDAVVGSVLGY